MCIPFGLTSSAFSSGSIAFEDSIEASSNVSELSCFAASFSEATTEFNSFFDFCFSVCFSNASLYFCFTWSENSFPEKRLFRIIRHHLFFFLPFLFEFRFLLFQ